MARVGIFDLKPPLTAPAESKVLRTVRGLEEPQVLLALLLHRPVSGDVRQGKGTRLSWASHRVGGGILI